MTSISLSNITVDFEQNKQKIVDLLQSTDSWRNIYTSSAGNVLLDVSADNRTNALFAIEAALREAFPDTARSPKSILNINTNIWGNRTARKIPARIQVQLTNNSLVNLTIPEYSQFNIGTYGFFNREPLQIASNSTLQIYLYQGTVTSVPQFFNGDLNELFYLGDPVTGFNISDVDLFATNGTTIFKKVGGSLFEYGPTQLNIFEDKTLPTGEVQVRFGDGNFGALPTPNTVLIFTYVITTGKTVNNLVITGEEVIYTSNSSVTGITTSPALNGEDQKDPSYYQLYGAALRSARVRGGGVTRDQYDAIGRGFPGVVDCKLLGQAETFPGDKNYMNVVTVLLVTDTPFTSQQNADFVTYMKNNTIWGNQFIFQTPVVVSSNVDVDIYVLPKADPALIENKVQSALNNLTVLKAGALGYSYYRSDIIKLIEVTVADDFDYCILNTPATDLVVDPDSYVQFGTATVNVFYSTRNVATVV